MCPESQIGNIAGKISLSLRISMIRNLSIAVLFAVCSATQLIPDKHSVPFDRNIDGAYCLQRPAVNPEVNSEARSIRWLSEYQSAIALERVRC
jgi:hypothetical protein